MSKSSNKTVLIVDDSYYIREKLKGILVKNGIKVAGEADNGLAAIKEYKRCQPDIVTLDIVMPKMQGIEALKKLKEINPNVIVIMISSTGTEKRIKEAIENGANNFILKPFNEKVIIDIIERVLINDCTAKT